MNLESAALLKLMLEEGVKTAEKLNKDFKLYHIKIKEITDISTVFGYDGRISIGVLPADERRVASILIGFHTDNDSHISIITTPKKIALFCLIIEKLILENISNS